MGKKSKFKKLQRKKYKFNKKKPSKNRIKNSSNNEKDKDNFNNVKKIKDKALMHRRKALRRKMKNFQKKNKNLFNVEHEYLDDIFMNQEDIERLPHDKFTIYQIPHTQEENNKYLPLLIDDSDIILELLDSRDIFHSRNNQIEDLINRNEKKLLIYILSKSDLVSSEYLSKIKNSLHKENNNPVINISSLKRETIQDLIIELKKYIEIFKEKINTEKIIKIGIIGAPNVGKNSLIQSLELIVNSNCNEKYIFFDEDNSFCINSVFCTIFDEDGEKNCLISKMNKNIKDIKEPKNIIENLMDYINKDNLKDIYELKKTPENLEDFICLIKQKYEFENEDLSIRKILGDIITGKIKYKINVN